MNVDHRQPNTFSVIVDRFIEIKGLNVNEIEYLEIGGGPNEIADEDLKEEFREYQRQIVLNAQHMAKCMSDLGFRIVSGGTDNHLFLVDLTPKNVTGNDAQVALEASGIMVNKNLIPFDTRTPNVTSGIRLGTPAITTRGMKEKEMEIICEMIDQVLRHLNDVSFMEKTRVKVRELCASFPFYKRIYDI